MQGIVRAGKHLALIALLLRALVPAGWMPGTAAASPFVICSVDGAVQHTPDGHKLPDDTAHHNACPFGATPHFVKTPEPVAIAVPSLRSMTVPQFGKTRPVPSLSAYRTQSPRAPPLNA